MKGCWSNEEGQLFPNSQSRQASHFFETERQFRNADKAIWHS